LRALALALVAALALLGAACGSTKRSGPAKLHVQQGLVPGSGLYIEGSFSYVRVEREGRLVRQVRLVKPSATIRLEPSSYRLVSFQRPCSPSCSGSLDPATDRCSEAFDAASGELVEATVRLSPGKGCTIAFE